METIREVPWITPYPDRLLDEIAPSDEEPEAVVVTRETIELAFLAALQVLPPRQRATLIARDVLGWPAIETASALDTSVASVNSALQRARATLQAHLPAQAHRLVGRRAERRRTRAARAASSRRTSAATRHSPCRSPSQDLRITMPPAPMLFEGLDVIAAAPRERAVRGRLAAAADDRQPHADRGELPARAGRHRSIAPFKLDVLRVVDGRIAEITTFGPALFPQFGLPELFPY